MSKKFLYRVNGTKNGLFKKFLDNLPDNPRIAWYPSAYTDFAPLVYLQNEYLSANPAINRDPAPPDLYLYTDYNLHDELFSLNKIHYHNEVSGEFQITGYEELPSLHLPFHDEIVNKISININRVFFLIVRVNNDTVNKEYPVLYVIAENEAFCAEMLIPDKVQLSHIIHKRYGGGCGGGGKATGLWMQNIRENFHAKCL